MEPDPILSNVALDHTAEGSRRLTKKRKLDSETTVSANAAIKVQPKKRAKGKGKAGKLEGLMLLPMDVLFEIFGHLRPLDILHLARTTKQFRSVLMHQSAISVWKAARANVPDFPDCFPGMNEAQFANLAFDQHCHVCLAPNIRSVDWILRVRLCPKCTKTSYVDVSLMSMLLNDEDEEWDEECKYLVSARDTTRSRRVAFVHELSSIKEHWQTLTDNKARTAYRRERIAYNAAIEQHATTCYAWFKTQQLDRVQELEQARQDRKKAIIEKLEDLGWGSEIQKIPIKDDLSGHKLVKQPTRLTERIWKNIQPEMVKHMEEMKMNRLNRERKALIIARKFPAINVLREYKKSLLPWTEPIMPEPVDFCDFAPVKTVLELPNEVEVDESSFADIIPLLPSLFADWRVDIGKQMLKGFGRMLKQRATRDFAFYGGPFGGFAREDTESVDEDSSDEDTELAENIALATTVFKCHDCSFSNWATNYWDLSDDDDDEDFAFSQGSSVAREPLFYPQVMGHQCLTRQVDFSCDRSDPSVFLEQLDRTRTSWSCKKLEVSKEAKTMMEVIVERCGLEPLFATSKDMDNQDTLLGCPLCANWTDSTSDDAEIPVFGWRAALKHQALKHFHRGSVPWIKLSEDQAESARQTEEAVHGHSSCTHCLDRPSERKPTTLAFTIQHLLSKHDISQPQLNIDYAVNAVTCGRGYFKSNAIVMVERPEYDCFDLGFYSDDDDDDFPYY